jgi:hypothetical protein
LLQFGLNTLSHISTIVVTTIVVNEWNVKYALHIDMYALHSLN